MPSVEDMDKGNSDTAAVICGIMRDCSEIKNRVRHNTTCDAEVRKYMPDETSSETRNRVLDRMTRNTAGNILE